MLIHFIVRMPLRHLCKTRDKGFFALVSPTRKLKFSFCFPYHLHLLPTYQLLKQSQVHKNTTLLSYLPYNREMSSQQEHQEAVAALDRPTVIPRPPPYVAEPIARYVPASSLPSDPNNPIHTEQQQRMLWVLKYQGHWGLAMEIYEHARRQLEDSLVTSKKPWEYLCKDSDNESSYVYIQLLTLPTRVLESLIKNTITSDMSTDSEI